MEKEENARKTEKEKILEEESDNLIEKKAFCLFYFLFSRKNLMAFYSLISLS
ncbi:MAG: hypothetical protein Q7R70_06890 [Candidatus Diapherotrites archaeon]|nr:hypothetical protein [Candidatus Diapherotrites archaeon]